MSARACPLPTNEANAEKVIPLNSHERVLHALNRPEFMWRTAEGIAQETRLSLSNVEDVLSSMSNSLIYSSVPDDHNRPKFTTLEHYRGHAGILRRVLDTLSDQVR
jgi:hypothetical protein